MTNADFQVGSLNPTAAAGGASIASNAEVQLGPGTTTIDGAIYVNGMYVPNGMPRVTGGVIRSAECDCDSAHFLDVAGLVAARSRDNDNAAAQVAAARLNGFGNGVSLSLDCGRYYFDRVVGAGELRIEARGRVAIFVAGDLALDDGFTLTLADGATAELHIAGNVRVGGKLVLGGTDTGDRALMVVGGTGTIDLGGDATMDGSLYAPRAELVTRGTFELRGSLFVERANFERATIVRYASVPVLRQMCAP